MTDIMGNILAVNVHKANQHDTKGGVFVFEKALFCTLLSMQDVQMRGIEGL